MNPLLRVRAEGQQVWLDNLSRTLLNEGHLARLKGEAIDAETRYERLVIPDVQRACDLLRPLFDESRGNAGYVSLEVSPALAHDAARTVAAGLRLKHAVG